MPTRPKPALSAVPAPDAAPTPAHAIPADVACRIADLPDLPIASLRALFQETFAEPPAIANRRFLERRLAYHWQAQAFEALHPGVLAAQQARIAALAAQVATAEAATHRQPHVAGLTAGTVLVRWYNDVEHLVRVAGDGTFEYGGARYGSLSEVARKITGTRWSGRAFFGLTRGTRPSGHARQGPKR